MNGTKFNYLQTDILEAMDATGITKSLEDADKANKPGVCIAQIRDNGDIVMCFLPFEQACCLQKFFGGDPGKVIDNDGSTKFIDPSL